MRAAREREHVFAAEPHLARRRLDQPQDAAAGRRLAAARLADQPERLALLDREAHVVDRRDRRAARGTGRAPRMKCLTRCETSTSGISWARPRPGCDLRVDAAADRAGSTCAAWSAPTA